MPAAARPAAPPAAPSPSPATWRRSGPPAGSHAEVGHRRTQLGCSRGKPERGHGRQGVRLGCPRTTGGDVSPALERSLVAYVPANRWSCAGSYQESSRGRPRGSLTSRSRVRPRSCAAWPGPTWRRSRHGPRSAASGGRTPGGPPFCEPELGGRGDAGRTVLTGGVPARSAMIPVLTRGVRAPRRHDRPAGLVMFPAAITPGCPASSHGTRPGHGECLRALCTPASALPRLL